MKPLLKLLSSQPPLLLLLLSLLLFLLLLLLLLLLIIFFIIIIITMSRPHYCQSSTVLDCINAYSRERAWEGLHRTILGRERRIGPTTYEPGYRSQNSGTHPPLFFPWNTHKLNYYYLYCLKHLPCSKLSNKYE